MAKYKYRNQEMYHGVRLNIRANTISELTRKTEEKKRQIDRCSINPNIRLSDFTELYINTYKEPSVSDSLLRTIKSADKKMIEALGDVRIKDIKPIHIQAFFNTLSVYSEGTIALYSAYYFQIFRYAYRNGLTPVDYTVDLVTPAGKDERRRRSITAREREIMLKCLKGNPLEMLAKFSLYCGLRPGEAAALTWKDINLESGIVSVNKSLKSNGSIGAPKTRAGYRDVPIPAHFISELDKIQGSPFSLVCQYNGKPIYRYVIHRYWDHLKKDMNLAMGCRQINGELVPPLPLADDFVLYNLRHTYCTDLERAGVPINVARRLMGHSSISMTSKIYTHANEESFEAARELINKRATL